MTSPGHYLKEIAFHLNQDIWLSDLLLTAANLLDGFKFYFFNKIKILHRILHKIKIKIKILHMGNC